MSQTFLPASSASSPGLANGTYFTGTPSRSAIARAMSGDTPSGSPEALRPVTSRKLPRLMPARSTPVGASSLTTSGDMWADPVIGDVGRYSDRRRRGLHVGLYGVP